MINNSRETQFYKLSIGIVRGELTLNEIVELEYKLLSRKTKMMSKAIINETKVTLNQLDDMGLKVYSYKLSRLCDILCENKMISISTLLDLYKMFNEDVDKLHDFTRKNEIVAYRVKKAAEYCRGYISFMNMPLYTATFESNENVLTDEEVINKFSKMVDLNKLNGEIYYIAR